MNWHSASEFFAMGGYGPYVWGAYGVTALLMALEVWLASRRRRRALNESFEAGRSDVITAAAEQWEHVT